MTAGLNHEFINNVGNKVEIPFCIFLSFLGSRDNLFLENNNFALGLAPIFKISRNYNAQIVFIRYNRDTRG